jgi:outer membrane murein-binding lipoprotein Lpp
MKKIILTLAVVTTLLAGTVLTGCQSSAQKEESARKDLLEAKQDLKDAQNDANAEAQKVKLAEEWETFKKDAELTISNNEIRIADLRVKLGKPGTKLDAIYHKRIDAFEQQNKDLRKRIEDYEDSQSDWETFKREFNHDMDVLGDALQELTVNSQ